jgi:molybdopterin-binding protein
MIERRRSPYIVQNVSALNVIPSTRRVRAVLRIPDAERTAMRISARNQIKGKIVDLKKGATTAHVRVDIGGGQIVTSAITNEAVDELALKVGSAVIVLVKASDVMIAVD